jgi:hypothetical protein
MRDGAPYGALPRPDRRREQKETALPVTMTEFEPIDTTCMRCRQPARLRFAGPCPDCVAELTVRFPGIAREVATEEYTPKMNVTPNAVALKD